MEPSSEEEDETQLGTSTGTESYSHSIHITLGYVPTIILWGWGSMEPSSEEEDETQLGTSTGTESYSAQYTIVPRVGSNTQLVEGV